MQTENTHSADKKIILGAEQISQYLPTLQSKRVGLVVNQTSMIGKTHLVDVLLANGINVQTIFAPEHGFRGNYDAGEKFNSSLDQKTGIALVSIYGKNRKPSTEVMNNLDIIIFDIQDVGVRFYTYISSMHYMMEAAANAGVSFIVLDRPNPNGAFVDGPILKPEFSSFVGMHEIPLLHGMTVGEPALMFKGEKWLNTQKLLDLRFVTMKNYTRTMFYSLPVKPSPNLPNDTAIRLYPSLGFFEATPISIGRGTDFPFQVIGHNKVSVGQFAFTPISTPGAAISPKLMNEKLLGQDLRHSQTSGLDLNFIIEWHTVFKANGMTFFTRPSFMDKLSGTDTLRKAIEAGKKAEEIKASWQNDLADFTKLRSPYLLYSF
ncbi:DUF1343 domain-containing protein [Colwellia sp. MSW7]|uniref:DUF1343 domain-containing protein n=2 Tax=Colwellia maritima TaxID=2912588 RepID=A0ABS9X2S9_9GAMM|nr:DUF1343 domain-containing protein [Colwellia maritima]MCI2284541.1 DUF1343 domain-containing protein [Colwellia maritima]